jgi:hypothetical protein
MDTRKTFVLWVSQEPAGGARSTGLEGRLEEVDTGREMRFRSAEQLIACLTECIRSVAKEVDA